MISAILKSGYKYFNTGWKSYCAVKIAEKTGMTIPELMLYKESTKECSQYYCKKLSLFLKEYRAKRLERKMQTLQTQLQPVLTTVQNQNNKLSEIA